jgi:nucleoside-diphosphate-sugar epimerase
MQITTIIIGKNSNLSRAMLNRQSDFILISSRSLSLDIDILNQYKRKKINLIFNNFQPATQLDKFNNLAKYIENSILTTSRVLDYFQNTIINKIIYTSSSSVYGNNILCNEEDGLKPLNLHASLKISNEKLIEQFCMKNSIDYTITRVFNIYGGSDKFSIISKIIDSYLNKKELIIINNGNAIRDFIHIEDVASVYLRLLNVKDIKILNVGTGEGVSIKSILDYLSNNGINIQIKNITKKELKVSTSDNKLLYDYLKIRSFAKIENFLKVKLNL